MTLLDIAADVETLLRKFDPLQPRDMDGTWSAFGGIAAWAKDISASDGLVSARVDKGGLNLELINNTGGKSESGGLDRKAAFGLSGLLGTAATWNPIEDGFPGEGDGPSMVTRSVYTYPEGADDSLPSGYAQVSHDGTGNIELELLSSDEKVKLNRGEALRLSRALGRGATASRVSTPSGPVDIFPTDDNRRVGLRVTAADGSVVEPELDGKSWSRLTDAINVAREGFDDMEYFVKAGKDDNGDVVYPDLDSLEIKTNIGKLKVHREGRVTQLEDEDYGSEVLSFGPADGAWTVKFPGHYEHPMVEAMEAITEYSGIPGVQRGHADGSVRAIVAAELHSLLGREFSEAKAKRDRKGRFATKSGAQVLSELDDVVAKLGELRKNLREDERFDLDEALGFLDGVRASRKDRADAGVDYAELETSQYENPVRLELVHSDGMINIDFEGSEFLASAEDAEEIAGFLDEFTDNSDVNPFGGPETAIAERLTSSGELKAVLFANGMIEIGPAGQTPAPDDNIHLNLLLDPVSDFEDARSLADALEELAETAAREVAK